ncbi:MAG: TVP38/TMEM64 family protein [Lachnospiraceae bacterium]|nr:TVP38/TMEM64 family protein [Lachnospiraceae bacterium]
MNEEKKQGKHIKLIIFIGLILVILVLNHIFGWSKYIGDINNLKRLDEMVENNLPVALALYMGLTIVGCVVLALPGITFAIAAGLLFGPLLGTIACSVATTIGAMLAFIAGRFFLKDSIKPAAMKNKYLKKWLFDESGNNEIFILMITRLVPLFPYNLQNFAYGVTDIKFVTYSVCSLLFMLPGTAMYTVGTAGLADKENRILYIGIAIVLAVIVIAMGAFLKKKYVQPEESVEKEHEA